MPRKPLTLPQRPSCRGWGWGDSLPHPLPRGERGVGGGAPNLMHMRDARLPMGDQSNGVTDGVANAKRFLDWQSEVTDFKPYVYQGIRGSQATDRHSSDARAAMLTPCPAIRHNPTTPAAFGVRIWLKLVACPHL
jgi:hypothetical protein